MLVRVFMLAIGVCTTTICWAGGGVVQSPTGVAPDRYVYYPEPRHSTGMRFA